MIREVLGVVAGLILTGVVLGGFDVLYPIPALGILIICGWGLS